LSGDFLSGFRCRARLSFCRTGLSGGTGLGVAWLRRLGRRSCLADCGRGFESGRGSGRVCGTGLGAGSGVGGARLRRLGRRARPGSCRAGFGWGCALGSVRLGVIRRRIKAGVGRTRFDGGLCGRRVRFGGDSALHCAWLVWSDLRWQVGDCGAGFCRRRLNAAWLGRLGGGWRVDGCRPRFGRCGVGAV
jgi:hypothetical protein